MNHANDYLIVPVFLDETNARAKIQLNAKQWRAAVKICSRNGNASLTDYVEASHAGKVAKALRTGVESFNTDNKPKLNPRWANDCRQIFPDRNIGDETVELDERDKRAILGLADFLERYGVVRGVIVKQCPPEISAPQSPAKPNGTAVKSEPIALSTKPEAAAPAPAAVKRTARKAG